MKSSGHTSCRRWYIYYTELNGVRRYNIILSFEIYDLPIVGVVGNMDTLGVRWWPTVEVVEPTGGC